jgi:plasmid maintenance system antidote protein VapI
MANRDERYSLIKRQVEYGEIKEFTDIFKFITKTQVATDLGKKTGTFTELMNNVQKFTFEEIFSIGNLFDLDEDTMIKLVMRQYHNRKDSMTKI